MGALSADEVMADEANDEELSPIHVAIGSPEGHEITTVIPGVLYLGSDLVNETMVKEIEGYGVRQVLNMAFECEDVWGLSKREGWRYLKLHVQDHTNENIEDTFDTVVDYIYEWPLTPFRTFFFGLPASGKAAGVPTYVHCKAGKSRSATAVMAYLVKGEGMMLRHAYDFLRERRPCISPNIGFITALMRLEKKLYGKSTFVGEASLTAVAGGDDARMVESPVQESAPGVVFSCVAAGDPLSSPTPAFGVRQPGGRSSSAPISS
ncbi:MAG: protein-tyrosine phosphatase-like protein [Olpidium bornovanus]|uniref:protein-tyrosine-phosphatase n=1 Tax=Olpidium bornovanus TaxID=278681 RepID=A0A8H7ZUE7_9FUNG|nr:MAG: protein-tyrosine phosphatase-like protein [Olpidium bornovanus]